MSNKILNALGTLLAWILIIALFAVSSGFAIWGIKWVLKLLEVL